MYERTTGHSSVRTMYCIWNCTWTQTKLFWILVRNLGYSGFIKYSYTPLFVMLKFDTKKRFLNEKPHSGFNTYSKTMNKTWPHFNLSQCSKPAQPWLRAMEWIWSCLVSECLRVSCSLQSIRYIFSTGNN